MDAERAGRSGYTSSNHSWVAGWFQAETLEMANFYWPFTFAGSPRWKPNSHWLMAQAGVAGSATRDAAFSLTEEADCFFLMRRGRKRLGSLRNLSMGGVFSEDAEEVRSSKRRVGGGMGSATQLR